MKVSKFFIVLFTTLSMSMSFAASNDDIKVKAKVKQKKNGNVKMKLKVRGDEDAISSELFSLFSSGSWAELIERLKQLLAGYKELEDQNLQLQEQLEQQPEEKIVIVEKIVEVEKEVEEEKPFELSQEQINSLNTMVGGDDLISVEYEFEVVNMQSAKQLNVYGEVHNQVGMAAEENTWNVGVVALKDGAGDGQVSACRDAAESAVRGQGSILIKVIDIRRSDVYVSHMDVYKKLKEDFPESLFLYKKAKSMFVKAPYIMFNADEFDVSCEAILE